MTTMTRLHNFENGINKVAQTKKYYHIYHEKSTSPITISRTPILDQAFETENWKMFETAEAKYYNSL